MDKLKAIAYNNPIHVVHLNWSRPQQEDTNSSTKHHKTKQNNGIKNRNSTPLETFPVDCKSVQPQ